VDAPQGVRVVDAEGRAAPEGLVSAATCTLNGCTFTVPDLEQMRPIRAALGLREDAPLRVTLEASRTFGSTTSTVRQQIRIGGPPVSVPLITGLLVNGRPLEDGGEVILGESRPQDLEVTVVPDSGVSYLWYSSVGAISPEASRRAQLKPKRGANGNIVVVVREGPVGLAWAVLNARVACLPVFTDDVDAGPVVEATDDCAGPSRP
jgi:hypothetical protein